MGDNNKKSRKIGMPEQILIGLAAGILTGLFFGELTAPLKIVGDAYIGLMQMTVMPFIVLALIGGIGKLSARQGKLLLTRVAAIIIGLWLIGFYSIALFGASLPEAHTASFFSASLIKEPASFDFFGLFIPSNPFFSLSQNKVPAVVIFSLLCGAALIGLSFKDKITHATDMLLEVLSRVTGFIVNLSPIGVFFIAAAAAGTMNLDELARIQGYLVLLSVLCLALCFVVIPLLISAFTPFTNKDVSPLLRAAFILAFATGKTLIVLPLLMKGIQDIYRARGEHNEEVESNIDVLVPLAYSFPHLGRIMATAFVPFAGWYIGSSLSADQYPVLLGASTFVHFSNAPVSIPFLLDLMRLPSDLFQLFVVTGVYVGRLTDAVGAAYILAVTMLGVCAVTGTLKPQWRRLGLLAAGTFVFSLFVAFGGRWYLLKTADTEFSKEHVITSMQIMERNVDSTIVEPGPNPVKLAEGESHLDRIMARGLIRVGVDPNRLPFSYFNSSGDLAGFDVDMIDLLATDLGVGIEYVPIEPGQDIIELLNADYFDFAVGEFIDTVSLSQRLAFSDPYLYVSMALVVDDYRDKEFATLETIEDLGNVSIGVVDDDLFNDKIQAFFPTATVVKLESPLDFFEPEDPGTRPDALLFSAEAGSAWSIMYPRFQVVTPLPRPVRVPLVLPYSADADPKMDEFIDNWVMLRQNDGSLEDMFDYWILGEGTEVREPRWSIIRNVLGWVE